MNSCEQNCKVCTTVRWRLTRTCMPPSELRRILCTAPACTTGRNPVCARTHYTCTASRTHAPAPPGFTEAYTHPRRVSPCGSLHSTHPSHPNSPPGRPPLCTKLLSSSRPGCLRNSALQQPQALIPTEHPPLSASLLPPRRITHFGAGGGSSRRSGPLPNARHRPMSPAHAACACRVCPPTCKRGHTHTSPLIRPRARRAPGMSPPLYLDVQPALHTGHMSPSPRHSSNTA